MPKPQSPSRGAVRAQSLPSPRSSPLLRFLKLSLRHLRPFTRQVSEITVYLALSVGFGIGLARMQGVIVDRALLPGDRRALLTIMAVLVAAFVLVSIASLRQAYLMAWVSGMVMRGISRRMFSVVQWQHPEFFQRMPAGDIISRMTNDLGQIQFALTGAIAQGLRVILTLLAAIAVLLIEDWRLALVALAGTPLFFVSGRWLGPATAQASRTRQERFSDVTATLQENLAARSVVSAFGLQDQMIGHFTDRLNALFRAALRVTFLASLYGVSANSIAAAIQLTVLGAGGWLVTGGDVSIGTLFVFLALIAQIVGPVQSVSGIIQSLHQASGAMDRVDELLNARPAIRDHPNARPFRRLSGAIHFENVSFAYGAGEPALHALTLTIPAGSSVALVGQSGSGKSTIVSLLMRFYDPRQGRITFDGVDLRDGRLASLRWQIGVVFQDTVLFNISIRENIRLAHPAASDAEVEAAARAAEIHDAIARMPDRYDSLVGEGGNRLSGGERQRVAIARAIIRNPALLLLDEATSALDPATDAAVSSTLHRLARGRTTVSVTHRLAGASTADQIFVLDRGCLVEQGTHIELLRHGGRYAWMWHQQNGSHRTAAFAGVAESGATEHA
ncbi:MAG: ABC transporter ATP-binding protein [Dehalococcoidia bacterium]